jgi:hypothetical protein
VAFVTAFGKQPPNAALEKLGAIGQRRSCGCTTRPLQKGNHAQQRNAATQRKPA